MKDDEQRPHKKVHAPSLQDKPSPELMAGYARNIEKKLDLRMAYRTGTEFGAAFPLLGPHILPGLHEKNHYTVNVEANLSNYTMTITANTVGADSAMLEPQGVMDMSDDLKKTIEKKAKKLGGTVKLGEFSMEGSRQIIISAPTYPGMKNIFEGLFMEDLPKLASLFDRDSGALLQITK